MTAPRRCSGVLVSTIQSGCERKQRYSDEFGARAAGQVFGEKNQVRLFVYPCRLCRGWHLTKRPQRRETQAADYLFASAPR
jgi:hypothetical protein